MKTGISISQRVDKRAYMREWYKARKEHCQTYAREYRKKTPEKQILMRAKSRAKELNLDFDLDETDIVIPDYCPILNIKLELGGSSRASAPSIDRVDSTKGYVKGNIAIISHRANSLKNNMTIEEIIRMAKWAENVG